MSSKCLLSDISFSAIPRRLPERREIRGVLRGIQEVGVNLIQASIGRHEILLPGDADAKLRPFIGRKIRLSFIDGKHRVQEYRELGSKGYCMRVVA